ncbi:ATP-binding protein [Asticcacaulis benevestitus]|uniref:DNA mismatch repair protein n=1 Tax=Asticcacaulis benevestitus DSM 16100 = ATCC BAA-896 TaxID=1121022 RepID=V4PCH7_9CAUL|nr:ATP-binding protein [Asticcacaulis benevestitus]ESQ83005.1 hypothetical protein ABENE_20570 [Asticcacaulis benevestitus DSM 16100 = ATCC BAA-896]
MEVLELKAQHDALQRIVTTRDPVKALSEYIWNALDADATLVEVIFERNVLGGIESIVVRDNGTGITRNRVREDFENFGASWKRTVQSTQQKRVLHGKEGQGRLRFFSLAERASWTSVYREGDHLKKLSVKISAGLLNRSEIDDLELGVSDTATGTVVELYPLKESFDWVAGEKGRTEFTAIFAPYLLHYPDVAILNDGIPLNPSANIAFAHDFPKQVVIGPTRTIRDISLKVIEWNGSVGGRKIHFGGEDGVVLGAIPANVTAPGFEFSAYAYAPFFQEISDANLLEFDGLNDPDFTAVLEKLREDLGDHFRTRQTEKSKELIQELIEAGVYPYQGDPKDAVEKREREVFAIATHAVSSYSREFKRADDPIRKITLGLLKEAIKHNPESIHNILHHVFNLPKSKQDEFSGLLERTNLGNIISASHLIAERIVALEVLKGIVFNPKHRKTVKERGQLDILIQANTWIFGENFHITLAEAGLSKIMQRVAEELGSKNGKGKVRKPDGSVGRADTFLGRLVPHQNQMHREFLLVELKRPSLTIGRKESDQLEDYVNAIRSQPDFINTSTFWNFYLITGEYDDAVRERITQKDRAEGILLEKETHVVWVKTWSEIIRECEARLHFIANKLQIEVTDEEIERRIKDLKSSIVGGGGSDISGESDDA